MKPQIAPLAHPDSLAYNMLAYLLLNMARTRDLTRRRREPTGRGTALRWLVSMTFENRPVPAGGHEILDVLAARGCIVWMDAIGWNPPGTQYSQLTPKGESLLKSWNFKAGLTSGPATVPDRQTAEWPEIPPPITSSPRCSMCDENLTKGADPCGPLFHCKDCELVWYFDDGPGEYPDPNMPRCGDHHRPFAGFGAMLDGAMYVCRRLLGHTVNHAGLLVSDSEAEPARTWPLAKTRKHHHGGAA